MNARPKSIALLALRRVARSLMVSAPVHITQSNPANFVFRPGNRSGVRADACGRGRPAGTTTSGR
ncbi:hypothetical protein BVI2075_140040 [Burkholderia vietnamiensis]|nr:hypothetical protein BVI2075_140040 [Burkholderia vietnamiensis]